MLPKNFAQLFFLTKRTLKLVIRHKNPKEPAPAGEHIYSTILVVCRSILSKGSTPIRSMEGLGRSVPWRGMIRSMDGLVSGAPDRRPWPLPIAATLVTGQRSELWPSVDTGQGPAGSPHRHGPWRGSWRASRLGIFREPGHSIFSYRFLALDFDACPLHLRR